jgi:L-rhamnose mutarotase
MASYAWVLEVRPGYEEEYKKRHDEIWPEMLGTLRGRASPTTTSSATG